METIEALTEARARAAFDAEKGAPGAHEELDRIEGRIAALLRDHERKQLAAGEAARRAAAAQAAREAAERQALDEEHQRNDAAYRAAARRLGDVVRAARGHGEAAGSLVSAVELGRALEPVRANTEMVIRHYYRWIRNNTRQDGAALDKAAAQAGL